jgi:hypothetical protein
MKTVITLITNGGKVSGTYHGGAYIDIAWGDHDPMEVINVYDYAKDKAKIEHTPDAVRAEMEEWLTEMNPELVIYTHRAVVSNDNWEDWDYE